MNTHSIYNTMSALLLGLGLTLSPQLSSAQSEAPYPEDMACEDAGGVWDQNAEMVCAPCSPCLSSTGEVREDSAFSCTAECQPWCVCPEGKVFTGYDCVAPEDHLLLCSDERPEAVACTESGGTWTAGVDTCEYCIDERGARSGGSQCTFEYAVGCSCPEGLSPTEEGCKPDAEVLPPCDDISEGGAESPAGGAESPAGGAESPAGGAESPAGGAEGAQIISEGGCDQRVQRESMPLMLLGLALGLALRRAKLKVA